MITYGITFEISKRYPPPEIFFCVNYSQIQKFFNTDTGFWIETEYIWNKKLFKKIYLFNSFQTVGSFEKHKYKSSPRLSHMYDYFSKNSNKKTVAEPGDSTKVNILFMINLPPKKYNFFLSSILILQSSKLDKILSLAIINMEHIFEYFSIISPFELFMYHQFSINDSFLHFQRFVLIYRKSYILKCIFCFLWRSWLKGLYSLSGVSSEKRARLLMSELIRYHLISIDFYFHMWVINDRL